VESVYRIGIGFDAHPFSEGPRPLVLGGVAIPFPVGLEGYSDADVLTHALMDALLGAANLADIGALFPEGDPAFKDADSLKLLEQVCGLLQERGYRVVNVDCILILEEPRIGPFREQIQNRLAGALKVAAGRVSVKATTTERMGFTGREEGVAAQAVALLARAEEGNGA
jgi:2-C-methyl-D-erythritol 2,4-cyclodiphosphate synthase